MFFYICHSNDNGGASLRYLCTGPMARHASDLLPMLQILAEDKAPLLELDKVVDLDKLRVFWLEDDGGFPVITPVHRSPCLPWLFVVHSMLCRELREAGVRANWGNTKGKGKVARCYRKKKTQVRM